MSFSLAHQLKDAAVKLPLEHCLRTLAYFSAAAAVVAGIHAQHWGWSSLWLLACALSYPQLAYLISRVFRHSHAQGSQRALVLLDALNTGLAIVLLDFPLVPGALFLLMLGYSALIKGGRPRLFVSLSIALTAMLAFALLGLGSPRPQTPTSVTLTAMLFSALFFWLSAFYVHEQGLRLKQVQDDNRREQEKSAELARNLAKYLSPQVWESIFSGKKSVRLETQRKKLTVFFSDIRGFTELSEELEAEALTDLLNNYLNEMSKIALKYGGTIDKFIGDSVMVFFGDPSTQGAKKDAVAAVSMAIAMRKHMKVLRQQWRARGITKPLEIRMGLNSGYCTVGNFGADTRMDYTIIGREVNLASRLESAAEAGEILISHETYSLVKDLIMCRDKGQTTVKGFSRPVQIYQVVDSRRDLGARSSYVEHELPGFSMYLDTNGIQQLDKEKVIQALDEAAEKLRDKIIF